MILPYRGQCPFNVTMALCVHEKHRAYMRAAVARLGS